MKNESKQMTPIMIARESNTIVVSITGQPELRKTSFSTTAKRPINSLKKGKKTRYMTSIMIAKEPNTIFKP
jgi:hypothetical protein